MGRGTIVGIDLGTTNSAIGVWRDGRAQLVPNSLGHALTPSAVGLSDEGEILVGLAARERQPTHPKLTATAFKRFMGANRPINLGKKAFLPEELSALVLRALKADAEKYLGEPVEEAVITVPAYFNDKQRKATRRAGELAGLKVERLLNEPTAAALAYGIHQLEGDERKFLVFDLGGGTFDVSIIELFEGIIEVRASTGDTRLGGEDFNQALIELMCARYTSEWGKAAQLNEDLRQLLREAAERVRRTLTSDASATMRLVWREKAFDLEVTAADLERVCAPLIERLREPVLRALRDSQIPVEALREVVLVGGTTRMPLVRRAVTKMFGRFPANALNPDEAVALGAAVQAGLKARDAALGEIVMTDVCPYTLGVEVSERTPGGIRSGLFSPIIERNTVVPCSRMHAYQTIQDDQTKLTLKIYQGESRSVADNVPLGELNVPLPARKAGEAVVEVRFSYDINGLLEVDARVPLTGALHQKVIVDDDAMSAADLAKRRNALAALKVHPRDADANRAALARANRCYEDSLGDKRAHVGDLIARFEILLDKQDPRLIEPARDELHARLDAVEGSTWL